jgi:hypothetical protein
MSGTTATLPTITLPAAPPAPPNPATGPTETLPGPLVTPPTAPTTPTVTTTVPTGLPPTVNGSIPPNQSVSYKSSDLTILLEPAAPIPPAVAAQGVGYLATAGTVEELVFLDYDTVTGAPVSATMPGATVTAPPPSGPAPRLLPLNTGLTNLDLSSSTNPALPAATLHVDTTAGSPPVALTFTNGHAALVFNDPVVATANLQYAAPLTPFPV